MKNLIKKLVRWALKEEIVRLTQMADLADYNQHRLNTLIEGIDVSADIYTRPEYARSWAVISLQGRKCDYVKFVDLGDREVRDIAQFIDRYDRRKIDATPDVRHFFKQVTRITK